MKRWVVIVRGVAVGGLVVVLCAVSLILGGLIGIRVGMTNAHMDFCADDTSGRYIADAAIRRRVC